MAVSTTPDHLLISRDSPLLANCAITTPNHAPIAVSISTNSIATSPLPLHAVSAILIMTLNRASYHRELSLLQQRPRSKSNKPTITTPRCDIGLKQ